MVPAKSKKKKSKWRFIRIDFVETQFKATSGARYPPVNEVFEKFCGFKSEKES
tara:strand:+ start:1077 stop:1235 length:159 start_codon:yes stop_codon:yes gene_type:complete